jgi:SAM-dependent methyltransferase
VADESIRVTKDGRIIINRRFTEPVPAKPPGHDRQKNYPIGEGIAVPPLHDMGVLTAEGRVVKGMAAKFRQINRYAEIVGDALGGERGPLHVLDLGCGKSYLTFVLYHYLVNVRKLAVDLIGLDLKKNAVAQSNEAAKRYGYGGLRFETGEIQNYKRPADMVVSLHACDTATDFALAHAVKHGARYIFAAPCCQKELNSQMAAKALPVLTGYGIVKERLAALATDAIRTHVMTACGYSAQLLEFVDLTHTPKNLLIRAVKAKIPAAVRRSALQEVETLCGELRLKPAILRLIADPLGIR